MFFKFSFWWQGIFFAKLNWTWWPHSFLAYMLQHMQYTVDKCVYFLYSALITTNSKNNKKHQQSAATMPSKPAVTGKCQCFKNPTPLMSASVEGCLLSHVCSSVRVCVSEEAYGSHAEHTASSYYAHPRRREEKQEEAHIAHHSTLNSRLSGAISSNPPT